MQCAVELHQLAEGKWVGLKKTRVPGVKLVKHIWGVKTAPQTDSCGTCGDTGAITRW